jgi:hypothetical protein
VNNDLPYGGLIDGPIERQLFMDRAGAALTREDELAVFNNGQAVYHDDIGDYASNEPTMDGSAGLTYYFAAMEERGNKFSKMNLQLLFQLNKMNFPKFQNQQNKSHRKLLKFKL